MTAHTLLVHLARIEAVHLAGLVGQFRELLDDSTRDDGDPAVVRLTPPAYSDDAAAREFRELTRDDLLDRRAADADVVLATLGSAAQLPPAADDAALVEEVEIPLDPAAARSWMRTLAAIRLVLATRLGIAEADDHDPEDARFGIYDWVGYRLDGLVSAIDDMR